MRGWVVGFCVAMVSAAAGAQTPAERYTAARADMARHVGEYDVVHDDSPAAVSALKAMWKAESDFVLAYLEEHPKASAAQLGTSLCDFPAVDNDCEDADRTAAAEGLAGEAAEIGPGMFAVVLTTLSTAGLSTGTTVAVVGRREGKFAELWRLDRAAVGRGVDPHDLVVAWRADRAGRKCRADGSGHKPGSCGPLIARVGALPTDAEGRPRFFVDAYYEQDMGATMGKQTSVWRWDGEGATLQWSDWYAVMADQDGARFDGEKATLVIRQKGAFHTMYDCGSCVERPLEERVMVTKKGVLRLGTRSLAPELDAIDEFFARVAARESTRAVASAQVVATVGAGLREAFAASRKISPQWDSVGMITSSVARDTAHGAEVCLEADGLGIAYRFGMKRTADGGYFLEHAAAVAGGCPEPAFDTRENSGSGQSAGTQAH